MADANSYASGFIERFPQKRKEKPQGKAKVEGDGKPGKSEKGNQCWGKRKNSVLSQQGQVNRGYECNKDQQASLTQAGFTELYLRRCQSYYFRLPVYELRNSRGSQITPLRADAATVAGEAK